MESKLGSRQRAIVTAAWMLAGCTIDAVGLFDDGSGGSGSTGATSVTTGATGAATGTGGTGGAGGMGGAGSTTSATTTSATTTSATTASATTASATTSTGGTCPSDTYNLHVDNSDGLDAITVTPTGSQQLGDDESSWTFAARIRPSALAGNLFYRADANANFKLSFVNGVLVASVKDSSSGCATTSVTVASGAWSTVAFGLASSTLTLRSYDVNGTVVATATAPTECPGSVKLSDTSAVEIGGGFSGDIDDVVYAQSSPDTFLPNSNPPIGNLKLVLDFDGPTPLTNQSPNGPPPFALGEIGMPQYLCEMP
jgi:hypothetical protein